MPKSVSVIHYMAKRLITFSPDMGVLKAIQTLVEAGISGAPVVDSHGNVVGVLSEKDCFKVALDASYHGEWGGRVSEYISKDVKAIEVDTSILEVAEMFMESEFRRFPVLDKNRLVGQISRHDVLRALSTLRGK